MTEQSEAAYSAASARRERWADALAAGLSPESVEAAGVLLRELQRCVDVPATLETTTHG